LSGIGAPPSFSRAFVTVMSAMPLAKIARKMTVPVPEYETGREAI
jgi:hypothetical protein